MLSKKSIKFVKSLQIKKYRKQEQSFLIEGKKNVDELLRSHYELHSVYVTEAFYDEYSHKLDEKTTPVFLAKESELVQMGTFKSNNSVLAVGRIPSLSLPKFGPDEIVLVLDDVRDPGNLGTILRIADWYGIRRIVASPESADFYNPKVLHASMGSFSRVQLHYTALTDFLKHSDRPVYGAMLQGENLHQTTLTSSGCFLVMGNESNGISKEVEALLTHKLTIPNYGQAESLNVAIATAVLCDNFLRQKTGN
ncbi:MAG: RNA methyltransferase [Cytophagales bacterium]|nr:RNA methyltransferase [Cytophagales bacterium]